MKKIAYFVVIFTSTYTYAQTEFKPENSTELFSIEGDLDKDGIPEKVIAYTTAESTDLGFIREIQILKKVNDKWTILDQSRNALLPSSGGGMMGDPFDSISIEKGILIVNQNGGSSWKWSTTDKYRFQNNEFQLIGSTNIAGRPGNYWTETDINLSTGKIVYKKEVDDNTDPENGKNESETAFKKGLKINLKNRYSEDPKVIMKLPKTKQEVYL